MAGLFELSLHTHFNRFENNLNKFEGKTIPLQKILLVVFFVICIIAGNTHAEDTSNVVLVSHKTAPYKDVFAGFQNFLSQQGIKIDYDVHILENDLSETQQIIHHIKEEKADILFTVGNRATEMVLKDIADIPVVASMILKNIKLTKAKNATGVTLEFPIETEFYWLRQFLPEVRRIGVIYNPEENHEKIHLAKSVAKKMGLTLYTQEVNQPKDIPNALKNIAKNGDVLWGIPDTMVLNPQTARQILLFSFRNNIPFCGLSPNWVEAGALYSLCWDYTDIGMQGGEAALKIQQGSKPDSVPIAAPRKVLYSINLKTARQMKIKISQELLLNAHQVFKE